MKCKDTKCLAFYHLADLYLAKSTLLIMIKYDTKSIVFDTILFQKIINFVKSEYKKIDIYK